MASPNRWLLVFPLLAGPPAAANVTCCLVQGKHVCGMPPPLVCLDKPQVIFEKGGKVKREVAAPPTPEERQRRLAEEARRKEEERQNETQRRRDRVLLASYASEEEIDRLRERRLAEHKRAVEQARERLAEALATEKKLAEEKAALAGKPPSPDLIKRIADNQVEIAAQRELIAKSEAEMEATARRFEEEKARFRELKNNAASLNR